MALPLSICFVFAIVVLVALLTNAANDAPNEAPSWSAMELGLTWVAVALGAVAAAVLSLLPVYGSRRSVMDSSGTRVTEELRGETLLAVNGIDTLPLLLAPVLLAALPLFRGSAHQRRVRAGMMAVLLLGFTLLAGFSIGLFYVPSALAMLSVALIGVLKERVA